MNNFKQALTNWVKWIATKPHYLFLVAATIFGLLFIFRLAPLNGTDEFTHFPHEYQISQGMFWEQKLPGAQYGGYLPNNVNNMINQYRNLSRIPAGQSYQQTEASLNHQYSMTSNPGSKKVQAIFTSTVIYPPWAYVPGLIGLIIAKAAKLPLIWYVYLSRITCLMVWIGLAFLAIKLMPEPGKWFLVAIALLPTSLTQAATIGGDGLVTGLSWLVISLVLAIAAKKIKPSVPVLIATTAVAIYASLIKDGYFLLGLLPLALPMSVFANKIGGYVWKGITFVAVTGSSIWFTLRTVRAVKGVVLTPIVGENINSHQQISYMLSHPFAFGLHELWQPFTKSFDTIYLGIVGIMTNRLIYLSIMVMFLLFFSLYLGFSYSRKDEQIAIHRWPLVVSFSVVFVLSYFLLAAAFYIGETSVGATYVNGIYGRYYLPIIPLLLIWPLALKRKKLDHSLAPAAISIISIIGLIATVMSLG